MPTLCAPLALLLVLSHLNLGVLASNPKISTLNGTACLMKKEGVYPPWSLPRPPYPPLCQSAYIECDGSNPAGSLVEDGLGELEAPGGEGSVPAVFNWVTSGAALPGAIGTRGCDCEGAYGNGTLAAAACRVCEALQLAVLCDMRKAVGNEALSCVAPLPGQPGRYVNCTVDGPQVEEGELNDVDPAVQDVVDLELGLKEPTERFGILVQQDLADPMPDILKTAGLDQDQFIRLLREPGQQWTVWDIWETEANGGDGLFPTEEELAQLDGIVISGDSGSPSQAALSTLRELIVEQAAKGKRILGICGGMGEITRAYNGTYPSLMSMSDFDPFTSALPFGTANISINAAAREAINGSWAKQLPDSILINHMPTEYVAVLPARAVQLGYSNWEGPPYSFVDLYAAGPFDNVLAIKGHPEATDGATGRSITEAFLNHAADQIALGVAAPGPRQLPEWANQWASQQIGRMLASYRQYSDDQLMESYKQFSTVLKAFLKGE